jgi:hypothetical protein
VPSGVVCDLSQLFKKQTVAQDSWRIHLVALMKASLTGLVGLGPLHFTALLSFSFRLSIWGGGWAGRIAAS